MKRYIITGAPGAGKTAIIRQLELDGFSIIEEAATDIIAVKQAQDVADAWKNPSFLDAIANLQYGRRIRAAHLPGEIQFHDRCAVCTLALADYLGYPVTPALAAELKRIQSETIFQKRVFFVRNLGFVTPTEARRITFEETLHFEKIHEETYRRLGFELIDVAPASLLERVQFIESAINST